jgi:hypothetical protein
MTRWGLVHILLCVSHLHPSHPDPDRIVILSQVATQGIAHHHSTPWSGLGRGGFVIKRSHEEKIYSSVHEAIHACPYFAHARQASSRQLIRCRAGVWR